MMFHSQQTPTPGGGVALGKFAGYPEFLRPRETGEALDSLDTWIDEGTQTAFERWGPQWNTAFVMGAAYAFVWKARPDDMHLCGIIAPSRDAVGRDYPLVIATRFHPALVARAPHIVPLAFGDFLDEAYRIVDEARSTPMTVESFTAQVDRIGAVAVEEALRAEAEYAEWAYQTRLDEGWGAVFGSDRPLDHAAYALESIGAALVPVREHRSLESPLVLRLPLGAGGAAAAALWFDVVRRICRWSSVVPTGFWSGRQPGAHSPCRPRARPHVRRAVAPGSGHGAHLRPGRFGPLERAQPRDVRPGPDPPRGRRRGVDGRLPRRAGPVAGKPGKLSKALFPCFSPIFE